MPCNESERLSKDYIAKMFRKIDSKNRGWIGKDDIHDILLQMGVPTSTVHVKNVCNLMGKDAMERITLDEFIGFVRAREDELYDIFKSVKPDQYGRITTVKLARALLDKLEIAKDMQEALNLSSEFMSETDQRNVSFHEFTHVLLFMPNVDVRVLFDYWARASRIDLGEDFLLPAEPTLEKTRLNIFISGALAGCVSRTVTAPLDRLKVIMQAGKGDRSIRNGLTYMYKEGGFIGLWRGNLANCLKIGPESAIKFLCYGEYKRVVTAVTGGDARHPTSLEKFFAGAGAGVTSQTLIYPLEIIKTRMALSVTGEFSGLLHAFRSILLEGGVKGLFRGLSPSILGIVPYAGIDLMMFNTLKENWIARHRHLADKRAQNTPDVLTLLMFGATSSTCGQVVAYPLQLVRTRMQADKMGTNRRYTGMSDCMKKVFQEYGFLGFYRGIGPNFLKSIPSISISYAVFETVSSSLQHLQLPY